MRTISSRFSQAQTNAIFFVFVGYQAQDPLGYGRCGCVVMAIGFQKKGAVMFGRVALKYPHGVDSEGWILHNEKLAMERLQKHGFVSFIKCKRCKNKYMYIHARNN